MVATNAVHSPWGIAFNESQRLAISTDRTFYANQPNGGLKGLKVARSIALLSYRTYQAYADTQVESVNDKTTGYRAASYQNYQGEKIKRRFNAFSYYYLTKMFDSHDISRGRGTLEETLAAISQKTLVIGISSDILFPPAEQAFIAQHIPSATYIEIDSTYGHDGFLIEFEIMSRAIKKWLNETEGSYLIK